MNRNKFEYYLAILATLISFFGLFVSILTVSNFSDELIKLMVTILSSALGVGVAFTFGYFFNRKRGIAVFMSYSHSDKQVVEKIKSQLSERDIFVRSDSDIRVGENIKEAIAKNIEQSDVILILLSQNAVKSGWVQKEWDMASSGSLNILPVLLEKIDVPQNIKDFKYADLTENSNAAVDSLVESINAFSEVGLRSMSKT